MKIFISHQQADQVLASTIARRLATTHQIDTYLDVIDAQLAKAGEHIGDYLRREMGKCTQLIAVVSTNTKYSSWVPWEIGIATEKDFPLATYVGDQTTPPEFLQKWPVLKSVEDVDKYAVASNASTRASKSERGLLTEDSASRRSSTQEFFRTLRASLRQ